MDCCVAWFSFSKSVTFDGNTADSGAAFAVTDGSLTFEKPDVVRYRNGKVVDNEYSVRTCFDKLSSRTSQCRYLYELPSRRAQEYHRVGP